VQNALQQRRAGSLRLTISAAIPLPIGKLEIRETAILTRGDALLWLASRCAARSGALTRVAKQTHPDAVIDSADVAFGQNTIKVMATANNLDNLDAFLCVVTSLGLALLAAVAVIVSQGIGIASGFAAGAAFGVVGVLTLLLAFEGEDFALVLGGGGDGSPTFIELDFPLPGNDLLPTLTGFFIRLDESTMLMAARLGTRPDVLNTFLRALRRGRRHRHRTPDDGRIRPSDGPRLSGAKRRRCDLARSHHHPNFPPDPARRYRHHHKDPL
jgi:hypothetical protein